MDKMRLEKEIDHEIEILKKKYGRLAQQQATGSSSPSPTQYGRFTPTRLSNKPTEYDHTGYRTPPPVQRTAATSDGRRTPSMYPLPLATSSRSSSITSDTTPMIRPTGAMYTSRGTRMYDHQYPRQQTGAHTSSNVERVVIAHTGSTPRQSPRVTSSPAGSKY